MRNIILCGVQHEIDRRGAIRGLMDRTSRRNFVEKVIPRIQDSSVVIFEGAKLNRPLTSADSRYGRNLVELCPEMASSTKRPTLVRVDPRHSKNAKKMQRFVDAVNTLFRFCNRSIQLLEEPSTFDEMVARILSGDTPHQITASASRTVVDAAILVQAQTAAFTREHIQAIEAHQDAGDSFFVGGGAHAIDLHKVLGGELLPLCGDLDNPEFISYGLYRGYLGSHVFPASILEFARS